MDLSTFWTVTLSLLEGFGKTLEIFILTLLFSLPLGLVIAFGSMSKIWPVRKLSRLLVWVIRGTPLMLQLIIVFYGPGLLGSWAERFMIEHAQLMNANALINSLFSWLSQWECFDRFVAAIVSFVINYACYFSEIYRGGIESIPKGQYEAGQVLGMTKSQVFFKVVLLQVVKRIIPPMSNEIITLVKDTSLARIISVYEIIWAGQAFIKSDGLLWPLFYTGLFYLLFNGLLTVLFGKIEKKLDYFKA